MLELAGHYRRFGGINVASSAQKDATFAVSFALNADAKSALSFSRAPSVLSVCPNPTPTIATTATHQAIRTTTSLLCDGHESASRDADLRPFDILRAIV